MRISRTGNAPMIQSTRLKAWQCTFRKMALVRPPRLASAHSLIRSSSLLEGGPGCWRPCPNPERLPSLDRLSKMQVLLRTGPGRLHALPLHAVSSPVLQRLLQCLLRQECEFRERGKGKVWEAAVGLEGRGPGRGERSVG